MLFVRLLGGSVIQRHKLLKDFIKVTLEPGETRELTLHLPPQQLTYTDSDRQLKPAVGCRVLVGNLEEEIFFTK